MPAAVDLIGVYPSLTPCSGTYKVTVNSLYQMRHRIIQEALIQSKYDFNAALTSLNGSLDPRTLRNLKQQAKGDVRSQLDSLRQILEDNGTSFIRGYVIFHSLLMCLEWCLALRVGC